MVDSKQTVQNKLKWMVELVEENSTIDKEIT